MTFLGLVNVFLSLAVIGMAWWALRVAGRSYVLLINLAESMKSKAATTRQEPLSPAIPTGVVNMTTEHEVDVETRAERKGLVVDDM